MQSFATTSSSNPSSKFTNSADPRVGDGRGKPMNATEELEKGRAERGGARRFRPNRSSASNMVVKRLLVREALARHEEPVVGESRSFVCTIPGGRYIATVPPNAAPELHCGGSTTTRVKASVSGAPAVGGTDFSKTVSDAE